MSNYRDQTDAARRLEQYLLSQNIRLSHCKALEALAAVANAPNPNMMLSEQSRSEQPQSARCHGT
jgi:hypothetical protein